MNNALHFGTGNNATGTPLDYFAVVNARAGGFGCDVAADKALTVVSDSWYGPDHDDPERRDSLTVPWPTDRPTWHNPPYSDPEEVCKRSRVTGLYLCKKKRCRERGWHIDVRIPGCIDFMRKAAEERQRGVETWALVASRTDTEWFHEYVWDATTHREREGVSVEFLRGRLTFRRDGKPDPAPFPSLLVIFRPNRCAMCADGETCEYCFERFGRARETEGR